ncbi:unnamed protein product [Calypogeia fissa]
MEPASISKGMDVRLWTSCPRTVIRNSRVLAYKQDLGSSCCRCVLGDSLKVQRGADGHGIDKTGFLSSPMLPLHTSSSQYECGNQRRSQATKKVGGCNIEDEIEDFPSEKDPLLLKDGALFRGFPEDGSSLSPSSAQTGAKSVVYSIEEEGHIETEEKLLRALKERRTEDAWQFHEALRRGGMLASQVCLSRLVAQLSLKGTPSSLSRAQRVLVDLQKAEQVDLLDKDSLGLLVMASTRTGAGRYALSILRLMLQMDMCPPVKVWSAVVSRLGKHPYDAPLALELFDDICNFLELDFTSPSTSSRSNDGELGKMESTMSQPGSSKVNGTRKLIMLGKSVMPDTGALNAVLNACATLGLVQRAERLLDRMASCGIEPDLFTFNILIKLFAKADEGDQLLNILQEMEIAGIEPDLSTYNSLVSSYIRLGKLDEAERLVQSMQQTSMQPDPSKDGLGIIESKEGSESRDVLQQGEERSTDGTDISKEHDEVKDQRSHLVKQLWRRKIVPDVRTYTTLMKGYVKNGRLRDAVQLLIAMQNNDDSKSHPNEVTYTTIIAAFVNIGLMDDAKRVLLEMAAQKVPANLVTYNILLKGYCNAGQVATAYEVIGDMRKAGLSPDVVSYNTLINGCIQRDDNVGALEVFREMRRAKIGPTEISYTTLMNAFARNGQPQLVAEVFQEMRTHAWMRVDVIAWNVLIDGYCRAGHMDSAKQSFIQMKNEGFHPSVATYGSLVKGFSAAGKAGEVLVLWNEIQERTMAKKGDEVEPLEPDGGLLDCLVDTCLRAGFFQKSMEVVSCMEAQGILADKIKYKRMFIELYSTLYTSKHASARRRAKSAERRSAVDAFKFWLGLPNQYYQTDWDP